MDVDIKRLFIKKKCLKVKLNLDFWYKNDVKCSIKIKNTKPTPRSITHKNPINISESFRNAKTPTSIKYIPPVYRRSSKLELSV